MRVEQGRRVVDLAADLVDLAVDVEGAAVDEAADQRGGVDREAPVGAVVEPGIGRGVERLDPPVAEDPGLAVALVLAEPDVRVLVGVAPPVVLHLLAENVGKPGVLVPVDLAQDGPGRRAALAAEHGVHRVLRRARVPVEPDFRARRPDGRAEDVEAGLTDRTGLRDVGDVDAFHRLDRIDVGAQAGEGDQGSVAAADFAVERLVEAVAGRAEAQQVDLAVEQPLHRIADRTLDFAGAEDGQRALAGLDQQRRGDRVRLGRAAAAVEGAVADGMTVVRRVGEQRPEGARKVKPPRGWRHRRTGWSARSGPAGRWARRRRWPPSPSTPPARRS
jgi:hypothetical protein